MKIRKARKTDEKKIAQLLLDVFSKKPFNENAQLPAVVKSLRFYAKLGSIYVAQDDGIVGVVVFKQEQYWEGPVLIIEDLAVKNKQQGIGKALITFTEHYAKQHRLKYVSLATHKQAGAVSFYTKLGYKPETQTTHLWKRIKT